MNGVAVLSLVVMEQNKEVGHATVMDVLGQIKNQVCALHQLVQVCTIKAFLADNSKICSALKE